MSPAEEVIRLFESWGRLAYFGESVSILEHSLQSAWLARQVDAADPLIVAALVHDIGHLVHHLPENIANQGIDGRHERVGEAWLRSRFGAAVTEPVRLHVDAKRYLCFVDPDYSTKLSPSSVQSLKLQGGPYNNAEARAFESNPWHRDAVALRRWDDTAKSGNLKVPGLHAYRDLLDQVGRRSSTACT